MYLDFALLRFILRSLGIQAKAVNEAVNEAAKKPEGELAECTGPGTCRGRLVYRAAQRCFRSC
jgi:hypothetical protein